MEPLSEEQVRALGYALVYPDVDQVMPLMLPQPIAQQMMAHILDAVEGRKKFNKDTQQWDRGEDAAPPMSMVREDD